MILLVGPPGSGKSTFCQQVVLRSLAGDRPVIYVTTELGPSKSEAALKERGLGETETGLLSFIDAYNETVGLSAPDRHDTVTADCTSLSSIGIAISKLQEITGRKNILLVFDSLTSPYLLGGPEVVRFMRLTLSRFAGEGNSVLACFDEGSGKQEDLVAMMSLSNGVIKMNTEDSKQILNVIKHPKLNPTAIEVPGELDQLRWLKPSPDIINHNLGRQFFQAVSRGEEAWMRSGVGDFVNLFWPILVHWSGMLWDPKRFPKMKYEMNKEDWGTIKDFLPLFPMRMRLLFKLFLPKSFSNVKDVKRFIKFRGGSFGSFDQERSGIIEYLDDVSRTDEHHFRIYDSFDCCGFENVGAPMALYIPSSVAGMCLGFESLKGLDRDWNALETKCIGLGDPYCEFKLVPSEIDDLSDSLEKDSLVIENIHDQMMHSLMRFLIEGKPLVERPKLGNDIHIHAVGHTMGFPYLTGERYRMALRMGGAKAGKEIGEHLMDAGLNENKAVKRLLLLLEHCKVGKVTMDETIRMKENCESAAMKMMTIKVEEPCCYFTTGLLNGFFSAVKNQHVKEKRCIAMGDPYCEWEFR